MIRLQYLGHNLEVPEGQFVIGRSSKCQLSVDDPLISRQHAALTVNGDSATVEDLGSRNGVLVNGQRIVGAHVLRDGDTITVGSQVMTIHGILGHNAPRARRAEMQTLQTASLFDAQDEPTAHEHNFNLDKLEAPPDRRVHELSLIGAVAEKALAMGRADDAQRLLERPLKELLAQAKADRPCTPAVAQRAVALSVKLAAAQGRGDWVDFTFALYTIRRELLPQPVVDELYTVLRKVRCDATLLREYLDSLAQTADSFGPNERFMFSRIEGLEPLVGLK